MISSRLQSRSVTQSALILPKGLIDYATFQRESGWTAAQIDHAIANNEISAVQVGRRGIAFFLHEIPASSGSPLLFDYLDQQVDLKRAELAQAKARRGRAKKAWFASLLLDSFFDPFCGGGAL